MVKHRFIRQKYYCFKKSMFLLITNLNIDMYQIVFEILGITIIYFCVIYFILDYFNPLNNSIKFSLVTDCQLNWKHTITCFICKKQRKPYKIKKKMWKLFFYVKREFLFYIFIYMQCKVSYYNGPAGKHS